MTARTETWETVHELPMPDSVNVRVRLCLERKPGHCVTVTGAVWRFYDHQWVCVGEHGGGYFYFNQKDLDNGKVEKMTEVGYT